MFVSIYYKPSLFNAHTMIFIVHIFMNVNKLCLNQGAERVRHWTQCPTQGRQVTSDFRTILPESRVADKNRGTDR